MPDEVKRHRVFFALRPDAETAEHLSALAGHLVAGLPDKAMRIVPAQNLHMTLAFIGAVDAAQLATLQTLAAEISAEFLAFAATESAARQADERALRVRLDRLGFWAQGGILWAGSRPDRAIDTISSVVAPSRQRRLFQTQPGGRGALPKRLATLLFQRLHAAGFRLDARPFIPHVTLARGVRGIAVPHLETPLSWTARAFALVESIPQARHPRYATLVEFPLCLATPEEDAETGSEENAGAGYVDD
jgi:2'-5' RNA ligase